ncbi:sensor histidine kinase [Methylotetracoccus oryzae]|uniref:sensor histidine kinase n=1 Tax=Methylotetracoccus oryzae TaxID=1919059 RepID=UPI0022A78ED8|nr:PAS domain-containing protein [Methylotetracoccus oryzae]
MSLQTNACVEEAPPRFSQPSYHPQDGRRPRLPPTGECGQCSVSVHLAWGEHDGSSGVAARSGNLREKAEALSETARYAAAMRAIGDGIWEWQIATDRAYFDERYYALIGYEYNEFPASYAAWRERVHPDDIRCAEASLRHSVAAGTGFEIQFRMRHKSGYWIWIVARGRVIEHDAAGRASIMVGTLTDVTARKQTEQALLERERVLWSANSQLTEILRAHTTALSAETAHRMTAESELLKANEQLTVVAAACCRLAQDLALAEERERKRISRLLHDHLQQVLAAAKVRIARAAAVAPLSMQTSLMEVAALLTRSLEISSSLSTELYPPALMVSGLKGGLEWLACWMRDTHRLRVNLKMQELVSAIPDSHAIVVFDAVRELLFNTVKHAGVDSARVAMSQTKGRKLKVEVSDRGSGFDPAVVLREGGLQVSLGLPGIRERVLSIGGEFVVMSSPGNGSRFRIIVPVDTGTSA